MSDADQIIVDLHTLYQKCVQEGAEPKVLVLPPNILPRMKRLFHCSVYRDPMCPYSGCWLTFVPEWPDEQQSKEAEHADPSG